MSERRLFDPGLQPERTALAWRRTILAFLIGSATSLRLLPPVLGAWSLAIGVAGLLATVGLWALSAARARRMEQALLAPIALPSGGGLLALTAGFAACAAAICLIYAVARWQ